MIKSFRCKETEKVFKGLFSRCFSKQVQQKAFLRLSLLDEAKTYSQVVSIDPHFKVLKNDFHQYQIRVNKQYRLRFNMVDSSIVDLEIIDVQLKDFH